MGWGDFPVFNHCHTNLRSRVQIPGTDRNGRRAWCPAWDFSILKTETGDPEAGWMTLSPWIKWKVTQEGSRGKPWVSNCKHTHTCTCILMYANRHAHKQKQHTHINTHKCPGAHTREKRCKGHKYPNMKTANAALNAFIALSTSVKKPGLLLAPAFFFFVFFLWPAKCAKSTVMAYEWNRESLPSGNNVKVTQGNWFIDLTGPSDRIFLISLLYTVSQSFSTGLTSI